MNSIVFVICPNCNNNFPKWTKKRTTRILDRKYLKVRNCNTKTCCHRCSTIYNQTGQYTKKNDTK